LLPVTAIVVHGVDAFEHPDLGVHREAQTAQVVERLVVIVQLGAALDGAELIAPHRQLAARRHRRIFLAQAAGGGVARVGETSKALSRLCMGTRCVTSAKVADAAPPGRCVGESGVTRSGCCSSSDRSSSTSASNSASLTIGSSRSK